MMRVSLEDVEPGMKLARKLHYEFGGIMLNAGTEIQPEQIAKLKQFGIPALYLFEEEDDGLVVHEYLDGGTRFDLTRRIGRIYEGLRRETRDLLSAEDLHEGSMADLQRKFESERMKAILARMKLKESFVDIVEKIIDGILSDEELCLCAGAIKTPRTHLVDHSIDVSIHSVVLAKKLGATRNELKELLIGALLHDIGYVFVPEDVVQGTRPLTAQDEALRKKHTVFGYFLLKDRPDVSLLSAHVAYQHHEQQDGEGYPRGLDGCNDIFRPKEAPGWVDPSRQIHRYAEIVAVPNYYDNLISERPGSPAVAPEDAFRKMEEVSGETLNRKVVELFLSYLPIFPVGTKIEVISGKYTGHIGYVTNVFISARESPTIRLRQGERGRLSKPIELDLRQEKDVEIRTVR